MSSTVTLQQLVDARKVLAAVEAHARKSHQSMAEVRVLHGMLDALTLRLAAGRSTGSSLTYFPAPTPFPPFTTFTTFTRLAATR